MKFAIEIDLGECIYADEALSYFPIFFRYRRFICPECKKRVILAISQERENYFRHKDSSPACSLYIGSDPLYYSKEKRPIYFHKTADVFKFVGFKSFDTIEGPIQYRQLFNKIESKYLPTLFHKDYFLWIIDPIVKYSRRDLIITSKIIQKMSVNGKCILFLINPEFDPSFIESPIPSIPLLIHRGTDVLFEVPERSSLKLDMVKIWLYNDDGTIEFGGKSSIFTIIRETGFSYAKIKRLIINLVNKNADANYDPTTTFKPDLVKTRKICYKCGVDHTFFIVSNYFDDILLWHTGGERDFIDRKDIKKIYCKCGKMLFEYEDLEKIWGSFQEQKIYDEKFDLLQQLN